MIKKTEKRQEETPLYKPCINEADVRSDGVCRIYFKIYVQTKRVMLKTNIFVSPDNWDIKERRVKPSDSLYDDKNLMLNETRMKIHNIFKKYHLQGKSITPDQLKMEYDNPSTDLDFYRWVFKQIELRKDLNKSTLVLHVSIFKKLQIFKKELSFSEIDFNFINNYERYLKSKMKNNQNTVHKNLKTIKTYLNQAIKMGIIEINPFERFQLKRGKTIKVALSIEELERIIKYYHSNYVNPKHKKLLTYFLFSCFTGLRISDVKRVSYDMIINDTLTLTPLKTKDSSGMEVNIPLNQSALNLIKGNLSGKLFKTYCDQMSNKSLKEVIDLLEIKKDISFHSGRHTFATIFLVKHPGDVATLKELMGHTNIEQTMEYVHIDEETKRERMKCFDGFL